MRSDLFGTNLEKGFTSEAMSLMKASDKGDVFFADDAMEIYPVQT